MGPHGGEEGFVGFLDGPVGGVVCLTLTQVDVEGLGVGVRGVYGVAEVHQEGFTLPAQAGLGV